MSIGAIFIGIAMLMLAIPFVINPLIKGKLEDLPAQTIDETDSTGNRHGEVLLALRDLEFDHQVGKIIDEDYANLRASLMHQAAVALEKEEKLDAEVEARLEQAIHLRREKRSEANVCTQCGSALDRSDRFCRRCGQPVERACPKCGGKLQPTDLFCNSCGAPLPALKTPAPVEGSS